MGGSSTGAIVGEALASIVALVLAYFAKRAFDRKRKHRRERRLRVRRGQAGQAWSDTSGFELRGSQLSQPSLQEHTDDDGAALPSTCWDLPIACFDDEGADDDEDNAYVMSVNAETLEKYLEEFDAPDVAKQLLDCFAGDEKALAAVVKDARQAKLKYSSHGHHPLSLLKSTEREAAPRPPAERA